MAIGIYECRLLSRYHLFDDRGGHYIQVMRQIERIGSLIFPVKSSPETFPGRESLFIH